MRRRTVTVPSDYASLPRERLVELIAGLLEVTRALERELEEFKAATKRAPFSKGSKPGKHKRPGRRPGKGRFTNRQPPTPDEVTHSETVPEPKS
jgi:hypothetical protein